VAADVSDKTTPGQGRPRTRPDFSLLVAAYQAEDTIAETLGSILEQDSVEWEAIVVDDGSTDATLAIAGSFADPRIHVASQHNAGAGHARNAAASLARGQWLLPLDADDMLLPGALAHQLAFMREHPGRDIYSLGVLVQASDGTRYPWPVGYRDDRVVEYDLVDLIDGNRLTAMTVISAEGFRELGGFRDVRLEDYDLWLRAIASGMRHIHNPESLVVYRQSTSSKNADLRARLLGTAEVLDDLAGGDSLPPRVRRAAEQKARYWRAVERRHRLERALLSGDRTGARSAYLDARPAYASALKWLVALPLMLLSPALFTRLVRAPVEEVPNVG